MATACSVDTYSSDLRSFSEFGCFGRGRRTPSSQGNGSHRGFFSLPPFASAFRSSRPTAEHPYSHNQNQSQTERRNEYNDPLTDPSSTWPNYSAMGPQSTFPNDDDARLQYSSYATQQVPQPYQSYRDPSSTSYSNHPTTLPPINVSGNHPRDERWQQNPYGSTSATSRVPETVFSPVASYPGPQFQYPPQPPQNMLPDPRFSLPINTSTSPSTGAVRRGPVSVERTATRSSAHTISPYSRHPPASDISSDHPPPKKKRKRADADQLRHLNEVYARTAFPSTEERHEMAAKLNMTPRSVQIWFQNKRQSMRNTNRQATVRAPGTDNPPGAHRTGSSRSGSIPSTATTATVPPHSTNPQQATYDPPSPTNTYFPIPRSSQSQQGVPGQYRSPSRNRENFSYYDGGSSRRTRD